VWAPREKRWSAAAFKNAPDSWHGDSNVLTDSLANSAFDIERHAGRIDMDYRLGVHGIDLSPAPSGDVSIGEAIENLDDTAGRLEPAADGGCDDCGGDSKTSR